MNIARILFPIRVLGPGDRVGIWLCGCARGCKGCSNPELWVQKPEYEIAPERVISLIDKIASAYVVDGFTISGGEPMDQPEALADLLQGLKSYSEDILIYTGYQLKTLQARTDEATGRILQTAAVLIDGPYVEEMNDNTVLRGSSNQQIHFLNERFLSRYQRYLSETHNQIQNFTTADGVVSVGIHHPTF